MPSLLLIAAHFAPSQAIGARRAERIAAHLTAKGWQVTVLSVRPEYSLPVDAGLQPPAGIELIRTHALMPVHWARRVRDRLRQGAESAAAPAAQTGAPARPGRLRAVAQMTRQHLEFPDEFRGWRPLARAAVRGRRFDVVLTTMPPFTSALLAAQIARDCGARLVLDYRDPWTEVHVAGAADPAAVSAHRRQEDQVLEAADLVVAVSPGIVRMLAPRTRAPVVLIPNAVAAVAATLEPGPDATIAYVGSLAYGRSLGPLLAAVRDVAAAGQPLRLVYAGPNDAVVRRDAQAVGAAGVLEAFGPVAKAEANRIVQSALAGVVLVAPGWAYSYPGKIFEILNFGRPLLALGPAGSDALALTEQCQLGWAVYDEKPELLRPVLAEIASRKGLVPRGLDAMSADRTMADLHAQLLALLLTK